MHRSWWRNLYGMHACRPAHDTVHVLDWGSLERLDWDLFDTRRVQNRWTRPTTIVGLWAVPCFCTGSLPVLRLFTVVLS